MSFDPTMSFDPSKITLASPPPGVTPNFVNPSSRCWDIYVTAGLCLSLVVLFESLRVYSKIYVTGKQTIDDYVMMFACLCFATYTGLIVAICNTGDGYGHHAWELTLASVTNREQLLLLVSNGFYGPTMAIVKLALLLLIYHIFKSFRWLRILVILGAVTIMLFYFTGMIFQIVVCSPWHGLNYIQMARTARCQKSILYGEVQGAFNLVSDFYVLVIPMPAVWALQMPTKKKVGIIAIFMTGLLACIASCFGLWTRTLLKTTKDITWDAVNPVLVAMVEMAIGIVVGCTPAVAAICRRESQTFARIIASIRSKLDFSRLSHGSLSKDKKVSSQKSRSEASDWGNESYMELTTKTTGGPSRKEPKRPIEDVTLSRW